MILLVYAVACIAFCAAFVLLGILPLARRELALLWQDVAALRRPGMADAEKEEHARRAGLRALGGSGRLMLRLAGTAAATVAPVWLADTAGLASAAAVGRFALRPDVLVATTGLVVLIVVLARRRGARRA